MTVMLIPDAILRIRNTPSRDHSRVAVFRLPTQTHVEVVFATAVRTVDRIESGDPRYLGTFDQTATAAELLRSLSNRVDAFTNKGVIR